MGGGASSLIRLRKAIIIRSYNLRKPDETVDQQFRKFTVRGEDGLLLISLHNIRNCLEMESKEYEWIDHLFLRIFGGQVTTINYADFISFLENGKMSQTATPRQEKSAENKVLLNQNGIPPVPSSHVLNGTATHSSHRSIADASSIRIEHLARSNSGKGSLASLHGDRDGLIHHATEESSVGGSPEYEDGGDEEHVMHINLSNAVLNPQSLPESVKLHSHDGFVPRSTSRHSEDDVEIAESTYSLIIHPSTVGKVNSTGSPSKPLWRKRETVRQERTIHYTTIDASGEQQELIEKETTQSEILHMECKETGQFAHRETTQYEQLETFNEEVVAETKGAEEYVHLKSLEDEYHYMESTMPNKEERDGQGGQASHEREEEGEATYGEPVREPHREGEAAADEAATAQAELEAEYAEAYHLYHQKMKDQRERGEGEAGEDSLVDQDLFSMSPRPPPPFSDDGHPTQGFHAGVGRGRPEEDRARDAFAFVEEMEQLEEENIHEEELVHGEEEGEQSQLFGDKIGTPPAPASSTRQSSGVRNKSYLFEPNPDVIPMHKGNSTAGVTIQVPVDSTDNYFSRTSSYESLHEID